MSKHYNLFQVSLLFDPPLILYTTIILFDLSNYTSHKILLRVLHRSYFMRVTVPRYIRAGPIQIDKHVYMIIHSINFITIKKSIHTCITIGLVCCQKC